MFVISSPLSRATSWQRCCLWLRLGRWCYVNRLPPCMAETVEVKHKWMLQLALLTTTFLNLTLSDLDHKGKCWGNLGKWLKKEDLFRAKVTRLVATQDKFSCSVVSDSLRPHGLQHARPRCPSPTPTACSNSCPSSRWCHPTISPSVIPFSSCLQSLPASGSFPMSQFFTPGGQSIGVSASASVLPVNIQDWFSLGWTGWGLLRVFSNTTVQKHQFFGTQLSLWSNSHIHTWSLEKP